MRSNQCAIARDIAERMHEASCNRELRSLKTFDDDQGQVEVNVETKNNYSALDDDEEDKTASEEPTTEIEAVENIDDDDDDNEKPGIGTDETGGQKDIIWQCPCGSDRPATIDVCLCGSGVHFVQHIKGRTQDKKMECPMKSMTRAHESSCCQITRTLK